MKIYFVCIGEESIAIEYLSAILKKHGYEVELLFEPDLFSQGEYITNYFLNKKFSFKDKIVEKIVNDKPNLVAFSVVTDNYQWACSVARMIKNKTSIPIVFGGIHPTAVPERVIKNDFVDFVICGEGEYAFLELVSAIENKSKTYEIKNLWYKQGKKIIKNELRLLIKDLDDLPFPDKDLFYEKAPYLQIKYRLMTGRGCPYNCTYCYNNLWHKLYCNEKTTVRRRTPDNVIEELKIAKNKYKIDSIFFVDDTFISDITWLKEFALKYRKYINIPFKCSTIPSLLNKENINLLKYAGCKRVHLGIQTVNEDLKKRICKRYDSNKHIINISKLLNDAGIHLFVDHMFGLPDETIDDHLEAAKFYNKIRPTQINKFWLAYYPRTEIVQIALDKGLLSKEDIERIEEGTHRSTFGTMKGYSEMSQFQALFGILPLLPKQWIEFIISKRIYKILPSTYFFTHVILRSFHMLFSKNLGGSSFKMAFMKYLHFLRPKNLRL